jgi:RHS repeat-associated protein
MGRVLSISKTISGDPTVRTTGFEYDFSGKTKKTIYPDAFEAAYSFYPGSNLLHTVVGSDQTVFATHSNYEPTGKMVQGDYGNGTQTLYGYDPKSTRLGSIFTSGPSGLPQDDIQDKTYRYSPAGDIIEINDNLKDVAYSYTYDKLHRLISETNTGTSDQWPSMVIENAHDTAHVHAVKTVNFNGIDYTNEYDANGNMTRGYDFSDPNQVAERLITFNADNMPVQIEYTKGSMNSITDILYDGDGKRAKKSIEGGSATYYYGEHFEIKNGLSTKYIFAGNLRIAQIKGSEVHYFHKDHLGSSTAVSDVAGGKIETAEYLPFGMLREHSGPEISNYKFTDQELDPETGLYNYDARLYDPVVGTFISPDPTVPRPFDPQSLNRFAYARNNPLRYIDPTGYEETGDEGSGSYGGNSSSDNGSGHDYGDDSGLNTGNKQAGSDEANTSAETGTSTGAGTSTGTGNSHDGNNNASGEDTGDTPPSAGVSLCDRPADGLLGDVGLNHGYGVNNITGTVHGTTGMSGSGPQARENPESDDCRVQSGSVGFENEISNHLDQHANDGLWGPGNDCHNALQDAVESVGLDYDGTPNGRWGGHWDRRWD